MIDFHTHIIPNVDDGSRSVEETFQLLQEAEKCGFNKIISTSHYMEGYFESPNWERRVWIDNLNKKLKEQGINIEIILANEIYLSENIIKLLEQDKASTINNTSYVLFEMPLNSKPLDLFDLTYEMLGNKLVPILAHPERYSFIQKEPNIIFELIEKGVLMQCNYGSFDGLYGSKAEALSRKMLSNNMVHFLGSDIHRKDTIYPIIPKIINDLNKEFGEEKIKELNLINPECVLNNKKIDIPEPVEFKSSIKMFINNLRKM